MSMAISAAMAMAMASKSCSSFLIVSHPSKKSRFAKKSLTCQRPFLPFYKCGYTYSALFSSPVPPDGANGAPASRSFAFLAPERVISKEESKKYQELIRASKLQLAPMMEYTDRHFRHLIRLVSGNTLLYTEMVAANALSHERAACMKEYQRIATGGSSTASPPSAHDIRDHYSDEYLQRYLKQGHVQPLEGPSVLQLGGSDPTQLYEAAQTVIDMTNRGHCDYTALNLNCGCPSPKVAGKGCFGAALIDDPKLVSELTTAMYEGCDRKLPVTVKCRIGTDSIESFSKDGYAEINQELEYGRLCQFIETVASNSPVTDFSVHARIAVLQKSYSPSDNRKIPPLKYELVRRLARDYPELTFTLNGGIDTLSQALTQLDECPELNGIMIGRGFAADPWGFAMADSLLYKDGGKQNVTPRNRLEILTEYGKHADFEEENGDPVKIRRFITKAVTHLFTAEPNAKRYRKALDEIGGLPKRLQREGKSLAAQPPLSDLILNAAKTHLSEEVLLKTPEESFKERLHDERKSALRLGRSSAVVDWQLDRIRQQKEKGISDSKAIIADSKITIRS